MGEWQEQGQAPASEASPAHCAELVNNGTGLKRQARSDMNGPACWLCCCVICCYSGRRVSGCSARKARCQLRHAKGCNNQRL